MTTIPLTKDLYDMLIRYGVDDVVQFTTDAIVLFIEGQDPNLNLDKLPIRPRPVADLDLVEIEIQLCQADSDCLQALESRNTPNAKAEYVALVNAIVTEYVRPLRRAHYSR